MSRKYYEKLLGEIQNQSKPVESKYGSYIMQKFGWAKGKGLGKLENGDVGIMKIRKYGEHGLGYEERKMEEDEKGGMWWENMYNNCAKKINQAGSKTASLPASEEKPEGKKNENIKYSIFVKKSDTSLNSGGDKCVSPNGDDQPSTHERAFEKEKKKNASVERGEKRTEGGTTRPSGGETDGQIKPSGADPNWKAKTSNALISKVAIISKVTNRSKKKKKKKWKKRNEWGKCSAKWKAPAGCTAAQG